MSDYLADGRPISVEEFTRRACDPFASVVVEACAGSGKTWLLVARVVRLLLAGHEPGEILAITFTRRAAQEVRERLLGVLQELAGAEDNVVERFLVERGMTAQAARAAVNPARMLYERVVTAKVPITIDTFHGWFWQLVARAPLGSGVPFSPMLMESSDRIQTDAWLHFSAALLREENAVVRTAWEWLIDEIGEFSARALLMQFLHKRAEWWSFAQGDDSSALQRALEPLRIVGEDDPCLDVRTPEFVEAIGLLVDFWQDIEDPGPSLVGMIRATARWLQAPLSLPAGDFRAVCEILLTQEFTPRVALQPAQMAKRLRASHRERYAAVHELVVGRLLELIEQRRAWRALRLNEAGLACGRLLIEAYQRLKERQQALDFTDLEWHAHRLLADPDHAAYMQARLDARYRQILLDEFQDTNPLQWQVLQSWLSGYGLLDSADAPGDDRPRVFIVGDPKQSIYRFRRADPRVFDAAADLMRRDYGAIHLRTNVTRRNSRTIIEVLNRAMVGNPLFQSQHTLSGAAGAFVLLPLEKEQPAAADQPSGLRDVLTAARDERDSESRYREGRVLANEISYRVRHTRVHCGDGTDRPADWSDVLVLVRRRTHLAHYERAFRDAGLPFVSDRRGGLLATLEAEDLTALLQFLTSTYADLRLAHVLRSPMFGCSDADLMQLAAGPEATWWERLQSLAWCTDDLLRARQLLQWWLDLAGVLPVHDLLDRIYHEGDIRRRYAVVAPAALHQQVQANLDAFIELALSIDAGRYPSLPRFIDELAGLKKDAADEAPDEGVAAGGNAVRVMTIHGAKGVEAEIVALADAHAQAGAEGENVLVVWPPEAAAPEHVSLVARGSLSAPDAARAAWFAEDEIQRVQEEWNLLYVAATRARQVLVISGTAPARREPGDSWYSRLSSAEELSAGAAPRQPTPPLPAERIVYDFLPEPQPSGQRVELKADTAAMRLGRAWHSFLEIGEGASVELIAREHGLTHSQAEEAAAAAARVRANVPKIFAPGGAAEIDLIGADGALMRVDRLAEIDGALWVIDFKWRVTDEERPHYEAQLRRYAEALRTIHNRKVRMGIVTAAAVLTEVADLTSVAST